MEVIEAVERVNENQKTIVYNKLLTLLGDVKVKLLLCLDWLLNRKQMICVKRLR